MTHFSLVYFASGPPLLTGVPHFKVRLWGLKRVSILAHSYLWKPCLSLVIGKNDSIVAIAFWVIPLLDPALRWRLRTNAMELKRVKEGGSRGCVLKGWPMAMNAFLCTSPCLPLPKTCTCAVTHGPSTTPHLLGIHRSYIPLKVSLTFTWILFPGWTCHWKKLGSLSYHISLVSFASCHLQPARDSFRIYIPILKDCVLNVNKTQP